MHPDDRASLRQAIRGALEGDGQYETEYRVMSPDSTVRWIAARGRIEFDYYGKPNQLRAISIDITERRRAEDAERQFPELQSLSLARTSSRGMSQTQKRSLAAIAARLMPSSLVRSWSCARRSRSQLISRPTIRIPPNPEKPATARMYHLYCSHSVGSLS